MSFVSLAVFRSLCLRPYRCHLGPVLSCPCFSATLNRSKVQLYRSSIMPMVQSEQRSSIQPPLVPPHSSQWLDRRNRGEVLSVYEETKQSPSLSTTIPSAVPFCHSDATAPSCDIPSAKDGWRSKVGRLDQSEPEPNVIAQPCTCGDGGCCGGSFIRCSGLGYLLLRRSSERV